VVGWQQTGQVSPWLLLLTLAMLAFFCAYEPLDVLAKSGINQLARQRAKGWLIFYGTLGEISGLILVGLSGRPGLILVGLGALEPLLIYLLAKKGRRERSLAVRLASIGGLTLSGLAAFYLVSGRLDNLALALWALSLIYFGTQLFYVRLWFEAKKRLRVGQAPLPPGLCGLLLGYLGVAGLGLSLLIAWQALPGTAGLAYAPMLVKLAMGLRRPPTYIPIKQIGLFEFGQSALFAILVILALR
jgi:hypothetical protein